MNARHLPRKPEAGTTSVAAKVVVPPQASPPEPGPPAERLAYSVEEAACLTGLSRDLLYDEMRRGNLGYLKVGRRRLITRQHLEQFLGITPRPQPPPDGTASDVKAATGAS
jgi:excisionase family DNA binding protein